MISNTEAPSLKGYRFPHSVITYAVWVYHRFALSLRDVEDLLAERGVVCQSASKRDPLSACKRDPFAVG